MIYDLALPQRRRFDLFDPEDNVFICFLAKKHCLFGPKGQIYASVEGLGTNFWCPWALLRDSITVRCLFEQFPSCSGYILLQVGELSRRVRSWPFGTPIGAFCPTVRALSDAPISVANGHDLGPLPS